jgi:hypothetical protein
VERLIGQFGVVTDSVVGVATDSAVGVATHYKLNGPELELRCGKQIYNSPDPSRLVLEPLSLLYNWNRNSFPEVIRPERGADHRPHLVSRLKLGTDKLLLFLCVFMFYCRFKFTLLQDGSAIPACQTVRVNRGNRCLVNIYKF